MASNDHTCIWLLLNWMIILSQSIYDWTFLSIKGPFNFFNMLFTSTNTVSLKFCDGNGTMTLSLLLVMFILLLLFSLLFYLLSLSWLLLIFLLGFLLLVVTSAPLRVSLVLSLSILPILLVLNEKHVLLEHYHYYYYCYCHYYY